MLAEGMNCDPDVTRLFLLCSDRSSELTTKICVVMYELDPVETQQLIGQCAKYCSASVDCPTTGRNRSTCAGSAAGSVQLHSSLGR